MQSTKNYHRESESCPVNSKASRTNAKKYSHPNAIPITKNGITAAFQYKGTVESYSKLPTTGLVIGDVYHITNDGGTDAHGVDIKAEDAVAYTGSGWDVISRIVDLSDSYAEDGSLLLTNDFTTAYKNKLDGIATGAKTISVKRPPLKEITSFTNKFEFLSNEYKCDVKYDNYTFQSAASLFYAFKAIESKGSFSKFQRLNALKARSKAANINNEDWEENKEYYLEKAVRAKFDSNPNLVKLLLKTGTATLLNNVTHLDDWIGIRKEKGENALGKCLMKLREEYRDKQKERV